MRKELSHWLQCVHELVQPIEQGQCWRLQRPKCGLVQLEGVAARLGRGQESARRCLAVLRGRASLRRLAEH